MINNIAEINKIESIMNIIHQESQERLKVLDEALVILREYNEACEHCNGAGGSTYRIVAEADREWHTCQKCNGTGQKCSETDFKNHIDKDLTSVEKFFGSKWWNSLKNEI